MFAYDFYTDIQAEFLQKLIKNVNHLSGSIIEIGCLEGKSTIYIANSCYPEKVICNDTWLGNIEESKLTGKLHISEIICQNQDIYSKFIYNMDTLTKGNYEVVKEDCLKWLPKYSEPIKFIHIDASHEYESVKKTIDLVKPLLVKGAIICGDDIKSAHEGRLDLHGGVERAVKESFSKFDTFENLWYATID